MPELTKRDFLKLGTLSLAGMTAFELGVFSQKEKTSLEKESLIDMSHYLVKGIDCYTINFPALRVIFPDLVKKSEEGGFKLINEKETPIVLDFSRAAGKEIKLTDNKCMVSKSNIPWEKANQESGLGSVSSGLILEGAFKVKGELGKEPIFDADGVDRAITFKGSGKENCSVEDVAFRSINAFKQNKEGVGDCPDPAFIAGMNVNLAVEGVKIDYTAVKPDGVNEENSQLAKGIILHNTKNQEPVDLLVSSSLIRGLQWDGITTNGLVRVKIDNSQLIQDRDYKHLRGVGVASTFNSPEGKITISRSTIDYSKGARIWINEDVESSLKDNTLELLNSKISNSGWTLGIERNQRVKIKNLEITLDYGVPLEFVEYWPVGMEWEGNRVGMSFDKLSFRLDPEIGDVIPLFYFLNWDEFNNFEGMSPSDFFTEYFSSWGDLIAKIESPQGETEVKITKDVFLRWLKDFSADKQSVNPSGMMLFFDIKEGKFLVKFATELDSTETMYFSEPFYIGSKRENTSHQERLASLKLLKSIKRTETTAKLA